MTKLAEAPERSCSPIAGRQRSRWALTSAACFSGLVVCVSAEQAPKYIDLEGVLERASARVTEYFARAQSIMCLEKVSLQKLSYGFSADGPARFVESELRLSWEPSPEDPTPKEARTLRQVLKVNGHAPRKKDYDNCTTPEQQETEEQPLSILLPGQRVELGGPEPFGVAGDLGSDGLAVVGQGHELDRATGRPERHGPDRGLAAPAHDGVQLGGDDVAALVHTLEVRGIDVFARDDVEQAHFVSLVSLPCGAMRVWTEEPAGTAQGAANDKPVASQGRHGTPSSSGPIQTIREAHLYEGLTSHAQAPRPTVNLLQ